MVTLFLLKQRQAAQCVGRVIRSKADYGMMIFADKRLVFSCPFFHEHRSTFTENVSTFTLEFAIAWMQLSILMLMSFLFFIFKTSPQCT